MTSARFKMQQQKEAAFLRRSHFDCWNASSKYRREADDVVFDAFCVCRTVLVAAQNAGRNESGLSVSPTACQVMAKRLHRCCGLTESEA